MIQNQEAREQFMPLMAILGGRIAKAYSHQCKLTDNLFKCIKKKGKVYTKPVRYCLLLRKDELSIAKFALLWLTVFPLLVNINLRKKINSLS